MHPITHVETGKSEAPLYASTTEGRDAVFAIVAGAARLKSIYGGSFTTPAKLQEAQRIAAELLVQVRQLQSRSQERGEQAIRAA